MRPLRHADLSAAGCALLRAAPADRPALLTRLLSEADAADAYRRRTGRLHPLWGNGALATPAMARPRAREPFLDDPDYAACLALICRAMIDRAGPGGGNPS